MTENEDRQLLEKAAKAAGIELRGWTETAIHGRAWGAMLTARGIGEETWWNPLTDDGDAFRLAVSTAQTVIVDPEDKKATVVWHCGVYHSEPFTRKADAAAATRRAIVHVAARIADHLLPAASIAEAGSVGGGVEK